MRKNYLAILLGVVFVLLSGVLLFNWSVASKGVVSVSDSLIKKNAINKADYKKGELIVKFKKNIFKKASLKNNKALSTIAPKKVKDESVKKLNSKFKVEKIVKLSSKKNNNFSNLGSMALKRPKGVKKIKLNNLYKLEFFKKINIDQAVEEYSKNSNVLYAEPNYKTEIMATPNDPYYSSYGSWGQDFYDLYGLYNISAGNAWDTTTGSSNVVAAVIDTGIDYTHPDLISNVWINSDEIPNNNIDDDSNGYIDDYYGYDFYNNDEDPIDDHGHGTHVSGTISAVSNNDLGVAGVSWNSKIMGLKFLSAGGYGYYSDAILAIQYAVDNGAQILSNSWGGWGRSHSLQDAIDYAYSNGAVFVAAAGNSNYDAYHFQPAGLNNVLTVSAVDSNDDKAYFSNYGSVVDVAAPGVDTLSLRANGTTMGTVVGSNYTYASGTSMATPHVSGLAALVLAAHPTMSNQEIENAIKNYADDFGETGFDIYYGYGRINAEQAVLAQVISLSSRYSIVTASPASLAVNGNSEILVTVKNTNNVVVAGKKVNFATNLGSLNKSSAYSDNNGLARATLSSSVSGTATITATAYGESLGQTRVVFSSESDITSPAKVTNFEAIAGDKSATLYWTNPADLDLAGILIKRKSAGYPENKDDGLEIYNGLGYTIADTGLVNGEIFYYSAFSYDASGNYSEAAQTTVKPKKSAGIDQIPPTPVTKLKAKQKDSKILLKWKNPKNSDFKGVMIRKSIVGFPVKYNEGDKVYKGKGKKIIGKKRLKKAFDENVKAGLTYYYSVFTFDNASNYSLVRRVKILVK